MILKAGIITFHRAANYGAVLQAYALNRAVTELGCQCEIIDYYNEVFEKNYRYISLKNCRSIRSFISAVLYGKIRNLKLKGFRDFVAQYCCLSRQSFGPETIQTLGPEYDVVITGSDQVWNLGLTGGDYHYFLDFVKTPVRRCSYAASIAGKANDPVQTERIRELLKSFDCITMREQSGKEYVDALEIGKETNVVLDPTLLLDKKAWRELGSSQKVESGLPEKYLLAYFVSPAEKHYEAARVMGEKLGLPVVLINYDHKKVKGMRNLRTVTPAQFVGLIDHADTVVTNSFHGTAFSINLQTDFVYLLNDEKPEKNVRIAGLVQALGLSDRELRTVDMTKQIPWANVAEKLEKIRQESLEILKNDILKAEYRKGE